MSSPPNDVILIVAPWLEGGGAQRALEQLLVHLPRERVHLITLFDGCRHDESVRALCGRTTALDHPRTFVGVFRAAVSLRRWVRVSRTVYSLMRASHVVLGLVPRGLLASRRLAATFHQLPGAERSGAIAVAEEIMIRRGLADAALVTTPAHTAIDDITARRLCNTDRLIFEPNLVREHCLPPEPIRTGRLKEIRLIFAGRLTAQKGLDRIPDLLEASNIPVWLRIVGDGPAEVELRRSLANVQPRHRVEMVPRTENVIPLIDWADAAFMPSRYELSPVFVWEAWQRGRGVLVSRISAFTELAKRGPVLMFTSSNEFAKAVQDIAEYPSRLSAEDAARNAVATMNRRSELVEFLAG